MLRRRTALIAAVLATTALSASIIRGQQLLGRPGSPTGDSPTIDPSRGARHLLRNGLDYLRTYKDYERALVYLREAEGRQGELTDRERVTLKQAIDQATKGLAAVANPTDASASDRGASHPAGTIAMAPPADGGTSPKPEPEPVQLVGGGSEAREPEPLSTGPTEPASAAVEPMPGPPPAIEPMPGPAPAVEPTTDPAIEPARGPDPATEPKPADLPALPAEDSARKPEAAPEPAAAPAPSPAVASEENPDLSPALRRVIERRRQMAEGTAPAPSAEPVALARQDLPPSGAPSPLPPLPGDATPPSSPNEPARDAAPAPAVEPTASPIPSAVETPASPPPPVVEPTATAPEPSASVVEPAPDPQPAPAAEVAIEQPSNPVVEQPPGPAAAEPAPASGSAVEPAPPPPAEELVAPAPAPTNEQPAPASGGLPALPGDAPSTTAAPASAEFPSTLPSHLDREVEELARRFEQEGVARRNQAATIGRDAGDLDLSGSRLELPRAPSPTEARPLRAIPVPEEFVPLEKRRWAPQRKYWAAAATCHGPLYFQDAVLERYGQSVEQTLGPVGRFFSYPLDNPKESKQRNQILQPFVSVGIFALQIAAWPYNMFVDPPWEAEWDLGYYRPGDRTPPDTYYWPWTGVGPPLRGRRY